MPKISVNGIATSYKYFGDDNKAKPTVIFIHGAAQSSESWEFQFDFCRSFTRFNFVIPDLPGHGASDGTGFRSIQLYSDFLIKFIEQSEFTEVVLVGHSMGGRISQVLIIDNPEKIIGTVLAGTGARIRVTRATLDAAKNDFGKFSELASGNSFSKFATKDLREKFKMRLDSSSQETCVNDLIACNEFDVKDNLSEIKVPSLIIAGEEDILAPVKYSKYLYEKIPDSRLETIKHAGHFMMQEKPNEFNHLLSNFLNFL